MDNLNPAVNDVAANFRKVRDSIEKSAASCGRAAGDVTLLAITKTFPPETVARAIAAGQRQFGENRVQEAESKIPLFREIAGIEWHLVGHLQSNKAHRAAQLFDVIHSVDSARIALKLNQSCLESGRRLSVLLQVDLGKEPAKSGADPAEIQLMLDLIAPLAAIEVDGLMTIPPFFGDPEDARPYFAELRRLRDALESRRPGCLGKRHLSMGMSHDFEVAIQEGATIIRIGTALFGERT